MKIKVNAGNGAVIGTHVGQGENRRMLFITPWGCSLSAPKPAPKDADVSARAYEVECSGEVEKLLRAAVKDGHKGLVERISIVGEDAKTFISPSFGKLNDTEENRLAARARDEQGWPYDKMTGASLEELRHMSEVKYGDLDKASPKGASK